MIWALCIGAYLLAGVPVVVSATRDGRADRGYHWWAYPAVLVLWLPLAAIACALAARDRWLP